MKYEEEIWPSDKWLQKCRENEAELKAGRMPNPYHTTEMMTIEEIIERYGIDQETIDKIKAIQKMNEITVEQLAAEIGDIINQDGDKCPDSQVIDEIVDLLKEYNLWTPRK